jgi:pimeloyl-ACP methyl ester carboxylesterase
MRNQVIFKSAAGRDAILDIYDSVLARWRLPYQAMELPTRHGRTFVITSGVESAPPLVLLHGSGSNSAMWIGDFPEYASKYRVYAVDIPGEPGKSEAVRAPLKGPTCEQWLADVLDALKVDKTALVGISLGAWFGLKFATANPERVDKLALLCPSGIAAQKVSFTLLAVLMMLTGRWGIERMTRIVNGNQAVPEQAIHYTHLIMENFSPRMDIMPLFSDEELRCLCMPVLLIVGAKDALLPSRKTARRLSRLLPHAEVVLLPESGHVLIDQSKRVLRFLSS